jgi:hypothetical protein
LDRGHVEEAAAGDAGIRENIVEERTQVAAHPDVHREGESPLGAASERWWQDVAQGGMQRRLGLTWVVLERCRLAPEPLNQRAVHQGYAQFEGVPHAHDVTVAQEHVGHVRPQFPRAHEFEHRLGIEVGGEIGVGRMKRRRVRNGTDQIGRKRLGGRTRGEDATLQGAGLHGVHGMLEHVGELAAASVAPAKATDHEPAGGERKGAPRWKQTSKARRSPERRVTAEQFVAAESRQRDGHATFASGLAGVVSVDPVAGRLVQRGEVAVEIGG